MNMVQQIQESKDAVLALSRISSQPGFKRMLEEIKSVRSEDRVETLLQLMNAREMRARGIRLPEGAAVSVKSASVEALDLVNPKPAPQAVDFEVCVEVGIPFTPIKVSKCWTITIDLDVDVD
jgi:hypothetical protein